MFRYLLGITTVLLLSAAPSVFAGDEASSDATAPAQAAEASQAQPDAKEVAAEPVESTEEETPAAEEDNAKGDETGLETNMEKASYFIGWSIGQRLAADGMELDMEKFLEGVQFGAKDEGPPANLSQLQAATMIYQSEQEKLAVERRKAKAKKNRADGIAFLEENKKKPNVIVLPSGLQYEVLQAGTGDRPQATSKVRVHYHGTLVDGTVFDSSVERGEPIVMQANRLIPGWVEALQLMQVGSKWRLYIPSALGYGARANPRIPAHSTLIFDVELLGIDGKP